MAFPDDRLDLVVELAFGADLTASPAGWTWTDVGGDVTDGEQLERLFDQELVVRRGRADESSRTQPASFSVMLDNSDGHLTPHHPMSKWWPNVVKGTPIRVSVPNPAGGVDYRFCGQVGSIAPDWEFGEPGDATPDAVVTISASGILRSLGRKNSPTRSALYRHWTSPDSTSVAYWPMEGGTDQYLLSPTGARAMTASGALSPGGGPDLPASDGLLLLPAEENGRWSVDVPPFTLVDHQWCVAVAVYIDEAPASGGDQVLRIQANDAPDTAGVEVLITIRPGDFQVAWTFDPVVGTLTQTFSSSGALGQWILLYVSADAAVFGTDYTAGWTAISGASGSASVTQNSLRAPRSPRIVRRSGVVQQDMAWGHLVVLSGTFSDLPTIDPTPYRAWVGETAVDRIVRLCAESSIPVTTPGTTDRAIAMGVQRPRKLIDLLVECAETDMGILGEQRAALGLEYRTRQTLYNQTPVLELNAGADGISAPLSGEEDDQPLVNDVTAQNTSTGGSRQVRDEASIARHGLYDSSVSVSVSSDERLDDIAGWKVHLGTWPGLRYPTLNVDLALNPALIETWLTLDLGDRITVDGLPDSHSPGLIDQLVQHVTERLSPYGWSVSMVGTPAGPWDVWILEDSVHGRADTKGSELGSAITDSETSLSVVSADSTWITTANQPAEFPFDIEIGGEVMTVTAITSTTSPQTFTVTRAVNGITKAHAFGAAVSLAHPAVMAL